MKDIVLFDMDGTLTKPRRSISNRTIECLGMLNRHIDVGIVSGSPYDYINEQMSEAWSLPYGLDFTRLKIMPCNGTQLYEFDDNKFSKKHDVDIIGKLGKQNYRYMISILTDLQNQIVESYEDMPFSGNFISFRGSTVNWCMIGRDANEIMRDEFVVMDKDFRSRYKKILDSELRRANISNIKTALGGSTSIDIYPEGWDKTYCLRHCEQYDKIYFVGDKCAPGQNDFELYESSRTKSFQTSGPDETESLMLQILGDLKVG